MGYLRQAIAHEQAEADYAAKRDLIQKAACTVEFIKADGTQRAMRVEPRKLPVKGEKAAKPAQRATKAKKARHPHLLPVWDADAAAIRSVNLATVTRIATGNAGHTF